LNIAFIVRKYQTSGGTERFTFNISKALAEMGHKITVFCNKKKIDPPNENIKLIKFPELPINRTFKTWWFYNLTNKRINLYDFDIVQGAGKVVKHDVYRAGGGFHKRFFKKMGKEKLDLYDKVVLKIEEKIFNPEFSKYIISLSHQLAKEINKEFHYPLDRIKIFHNPVDDTVFNVKNKDKIKKEFNEKYNIPENFVKFIFVANNFKLKGLYSILKVLGEINNCKLLVIGNDNFDEISQNFSKKLLDKIIFLGEKNIDELVNLYKASDVLIHPSFYDIFSNVTVEALSCGLPVIVSRADGSSEIITQNKEGVIIEDGSDLKGIKSAMEQFILNRDFLLKCSENAEKKSKEFSINNYAKRLIDFYRIVKKEKFENA
jgi:UDP-glucose:(heptosyl)LPS alpha-1,3-glucosyltransferase